MTPDVERRSAAVLPFPSPVAVVETVAPVRGIVQQLRASHAACCLAPAIFEADQQLHRIPADLLFDELRAELADRILDRAGIAVNLGDPVKRDVTNERAAVAILRHVAAGVASGALDQDSPLARLDLATVRAIAKVAVAGALDYLACKERC
jgi:hypothetical protein